MKLTKIIFYAIVFPAPAGMNRRGRVGKNDSACVPRARGDEPVSLTYPDG
ncbi:hypothetical protein SCOR_34800 [Sulfidibacter corallicola]